jgi:hypothetical protein
MEKNKKTENVKKDYFRGFLGQKKSGNFKRMYLMTFDVLSLCKTGLQML